MPPLLPYIHAAQVLKFNVLADAPSAVKQNTSIASVSGWFASHAIIVHASSDLTPVVHGNDDDGSLTVHASVDMAFKIYEDKQELKSRLH